VAVASGDGPPWGDADDRGPGWRDGGPGQHGGSMPGQPGQPGQPGMPGQRGGDDTE
jgi:hypothetical protein